MKGGNQEMKEIIGGCWLAGLLAWAVLGMIPGLILLGLGTLAESWELIKRAEAVKAENSWRKNYPPYRY